MAERTASPVGPGMPRWTCIVLGFLAPLSFLRIAGVNLTWFDLYVLLLGVWLLAWRRPVMIPHGALCLGGLLIVGLSAASQRAPDPVAALGQILQWAFIFAVVVPVIYSVGRPPRAFALVALGVALAMAVVVLFGAYETLLLGKVTRRYGSILGDPQVLGFQIATAIPFVLFLLLDARRARRRLVSIALGAFALGVSAGMVWLLRLSLSRTGVVATGTAVVVFAALPGRGGRHLLGATVLRASLVVMVLVAGFLAYLQTVASAQVQARVHMSLSADSPEVDDRLRGYREALTGVDPSYYVVGIGPDNYQHISTYKRVHNVILLMLVEGGLLPAATFGALLAYFIGRTLIALRRRVGLRSGRILITTAASMSAYVVIAMLNTQSVHRFYWLTFALGLAAASRARRQQAALRGRLSPNSIS